jgi:hypothetical protein
MSLLWAHGRTKSGRKSLREITLQAPANRATFGQPKGEANTLRLLNILLGHTAVFGVAIIISSSCKVIYPPTAFRCSPFEQDNCPTSGNTDYVCCSDDPAALLLTDGVDGVDDQVTPNYQGRGGEGTPIFSAGNNPLSKSGMCIEVGSVAPAFALADINAQGCPVPCNPTWNASDVEAVCGAGTFCCQTTELEMEDCVFDSTQGDNGCFRPVTGYDILGSNSLTNWSGTAHATHQDPSGLNCEVFVAGLAGTGVLDSELTAGVVLDECYRRLTVANQRGFCIGGPTVAGCPLAQPAYRDACEQQNDANFLTGCD